VYQTGELAAQGVELAVVAVVAPFMLPTQIQLEAPGAQVVLGTL
jgi:hypothetical protein